MAHYNNIGLEERIHDHCNIFSISVPEFETDTLSSFMLIFTKLLQVGVNILHNFVHRNVYIENTG